MKNKRINGKIVSWNQNKGFGFIMPSDGGDRIFVHINAFMNRKQQPKVNHVVSYSASTDKQGRSCADRVTKAGVKLSKANRSTKSAKLIASAALFLIVVGISVLLEIVTTLFVPLYFGLSLLTFIVYAMDKSAAKSGSWRTPESTLHLLAIAGGWPGAIIAQQTLRHKSKKQSFRLVFWLTTILNIGAFIWFHTPDGADALSRIVNVPL